MKQYRYPGAKPFSSGQQDIFFGREEDIQRLFELISLEQLVVLYSKSGFGKSSLLNAGIIPRTQAGKKHRPFTIRLGAFTEDKAESPKTATQSPIALPDLASSYLDQLLPHDDSLWYHVKNRQAYSGESGGYLLLFDQFEELFTYPEAQILEFKQQLKELLNNQVPQRFREALEQQYAEKAVRLSDLELEWLHQPFDLKIIMAIRSDRMSLLNNLKDYLPNILRHSYELDALSEAQAEDAILNPAYKKSKSFIAPPFDYDDEALEAMLAFLTKGHTQKIESFQLQILCQTLENKVIDLGLKRIARVDVGDIESIYKNYYDNQIRRLGAPKEQLAARKFIEDGLIFEEEERRLSLYEGQIYKNFGITAELLSRLVDSHLLRAEPAIQGGFTYELSHDTLVQPVLASKARRLAAEQEAAAEKEYMAQELALARERRRRRRANLVAAAGVVLSLIAAAASVLAIERSQRAQQMESRALEARAQAEQQAAAAIAAQKLAEERLLNFQQEEADKVLREVDNILQRAGELQRKGYAAPAKALLHDATEKLAFYPNNPLLQQKRVEILQMSD